MTASKILNDLNDLMTLMTTLDHCPFLTFTGFQAAFSDAIIDYQAVTVKCEVNFEKHFIFLLSLFFVPFGSHS